MKQITPAFLTTMGLALMAAALVACHDDDCDDSFDEGNRDAEVVSYRDPATGECQASGRPPGGSGGCGGDFALEEAPQADPDRAICFGGCEGNDEITCVSTDFCRAIYQGDEFIDCWGTAPSGPAVGLQCAGLGAYECSRTDHCAAVHAAGGAFLTCVDEKRGCASSSECGGNDTCSTERGECLAGPGCQFGPCDDGCWGFCDGPNGDPGSCVGEVACDEAEPDCPAGTIAGRDAACWTGYCIPVEACDATPSCSSLSESECVASSSCNGLYRGEDCSCDIDNNCSCTSYIYEGCGS